MYCIYAKNSAFVHNDFSMNFNDITESFFVSEVI